MEKNVSINFNNLDEIDNSLTPQEFKERLVLLLQPILDKVFVSDIQKRKIQIHHDRIACACPYCSDSAQSSHKKRGNFILSGKYNGFFKCHNCGEFKKITNFFKDFKIELRLDAVNYLTSNLGDFSTYEGAKYDMSMFLDMDHLDKYAIDRQEFLHYFGLVEVKDSPVWSWLTNRLQYKEDKFLYNPNNNYIFILNLTQSGKILGAQKRLFKGGNRFESYKLSKLYEVMKKTLDVNEEQLDYLDTISMIFNICLINFSFPIVLHEGPMDAFLVRNSIANTGANKELPIDIPVKYLYDSDETGVKKSIEHINKGEDVFLWRKFLTDIGAPYRKKWDINDIFLWGKENNKKIPNVMFYFSKDPLDIIDI